MTAIVSHASIGGFDAVVIENQFLRAVVIPTLGGRVWELEDRIRGRQWIWHRPDVPLQAVPTGSVYDDVWAGGWEELFPNDAPGSFEGRELPDHGEWWTLPWHVASIEAGPRASLVLESRSSAVKATCVKEFVLGHNAPTLTVNYRIRSQEARAFHYLFKQHLPVAITPGCRLSLPGGQVTPVDCAFSTLLASADSFQWPLAATSGVTVDLRRIPPQSSKLQEFVYVQGLPDGWCAVHDEERSASLTMSFDPKVMPYVWLFLSYGGWRDLYTAVLEPCSNMPKDLASAVRLGQSARLEAGQEFATSVSVTLGGLPGGEPEARDLHAELIT